MNYFDHAARLLRDWRGDNYIFGSGVSGQAGELAVRFGRRFLIVGSSRRHEQLVATIRESVEKAGGEIVGMCPGAQPNAPRPDVFRISSEIASATASHGCDAVIAIGGGSTIDACKAALALAALCGQDEASYEKTLDSLFGTGLVAKALEEREKAALSAEESSCENAREVSCAIAPHMLPLIAVATSASSGAHLTKYSNITDPAAGQKLLIVDPAIVPAAALFDYDVTESMPASVTIDGALDGIAHTWEVFCGASGAKKESYPLAKEIAETAIELIVEYAGQAIGDGGKDSVADCESQVIGDSQAACDSETTGNSENACDRKLARTALGLATDLGAYAIMIGGTSGAHLTSFSLVDVAAHGTACGIMNPYYTVFYAPAIEPQLECMRDILMRHDLIDPEQEMSDADSEAEISGQGTRALAEDVAAGMIAFSRSIGAPATLAELPGFNESHIERILSAAKEPQLAMKLHNMPVPMTAADVDEFMAPVIRAAVSGELGGIKNM